MPTAIDLTPPRPPPSLSGSTTLLYVPTRPVIAANMRLTDWHSDALKSPHILHDVRVNFLFQLIADDISRIRGGDGENFRFQIAHQNAVSYSEQRCFGGFLFFHFIVFSLRWDTPPVNAVDFGFGIEVCVN